MQVVIALHLMLNTKPSLVFAPYIDINRILQEFSDLEYDLFGGKLLSSICARPHFCEVKCW